MVQLPPGRSVKEAIARYERTGLFEYVEPDYELHAVATPNDPSYLDGTLWGLHNTGQSGGTPDADIDAPEAWDTRTNAENIIVAVIDTGIRVTHEDVAANMWHNPGEISGNGIDDDGNGYIDDVHGIDAITGSGDPADVCGHGTHVAGTIGAVGNNGLGVCGVAWRVQLMACKFLDPGGFGCSGSTSDGIECINYAIDKGAHIMSNSWGGDGPDPALQDAIEAARDAGIIFVAAAGNNSSDNDAAPFYPANYDVNNVVSVAATDRNDALAGFSNFGANTVDLAAPGVNVYSCYNGSDSDYTFLSGTSMATPHVSGVLALVKAQYPSDTYTQLIYRVLGNTDPLPSLIGKCVTEGRLNLQKALTLSPGPIARFTASPNSGEPPLTVQFADTSIGTITSRSWDFDDGSPLSNLSNPAHAFTELGTYNVTLTVSGPQGSASKTRPIVVAHNYQMQPTTFSWIDPSGMDSLTLTDDSVSAAQPLPFPFTYYGQTYTNLYVSSNGMIGFASSGLTKFVNADLPGTATPNAMICPWWDDLNPAVAGTVHIGMIGMAPDRVVAVSWVGVPHFVDFDALTPFTCQVLLYEGSNSIVFQYLETQPGNVSLGAGRAATIGVEDQAGVVAKKYSYNGSTTVTNQQAILFTMPVLPSFSMDGSVDSTNYLQTASGIPLYAAVRGQMLYVATTSPGTNGPNDHFVFVTDELLPSASASSPWAKVGTVAVAGTKPFLGAESQTAFVGWFNPPAFAQAAKSPTSSGQMEGVIDLVQAFGSMPATLYLAAAAYATADGGVLKSQAPAGDGNGNIESNEFLAVPLVALIDNNADGLYDRLDPTLDFVVTDVQSGDGTNTVTWASVPGKVYLVEYADSPPGPWEDLPGGQVAADAGQVTLSVSDPAAGGVLQRFYRIKLLP